jgi:hypothetical protein
MKTSKISKINFVKTWSGEKGTVYYHDVEFENGDKGSAGFNKECPAEYEIGTTHDYELTPNANPQYAGKIKFIKANGGGGGFKKNPASNAGFSLAYAKDVLVASIMSPDQTKRLTTDQMFLLAEKMYTWLEARKS